MKNFTATLHAKESIAPGIFQMHFTLAPGDSLEFKAGQYVILKVGDVRRLYSISSPEYITDSFELTVEIVPGGIGSSFFDALQIGQQADFMGPAGFFTLRSNDVPKIFMATGTGIAPMRSQIMTLLEDPAGKRTQAPLHLFWGTPNREHRYYYSDLTSLDTKHDNFRMHFCHDQEKSADGLDAVFCRLGRIDHLLNEDLGVSIPREAIEKYEFYLCARQQIVQSLTTFLKSIGVTDDRIFHDKFT